MADNYVALKIKATDDAKPDLTDLKARLDELKGKVATARADVDDVEADAKLAALEAKLAAVGKRVASPRIDMVGGARAVADITAVDAVLRKMADEAKKAAAETDASLVVVQEEMKKTGRAAEVMAAKTRLAGLNAAKGIGLFSLGAAGLSMAGPFAAAGLAAVAFGAVAIPVLHKVATAHAALAKAQQQYANASTGKQRTAALKAEEQATSGLTSSQKGLMGQVAQLGKTWSGLQNAMTPVVVQVTSMALKLAQALLPAMDKLVPAGAKLLDGLIGPLTKLVSSPFFAQFTDQMTKMAGQAGALLGPQLVKLIELFMQLFMQAGPAGVQLLSVLLPLIIQLASDLVPVISFVAKVVAAILSWLQSTHLLLPVLALVAIAVLAMEAPVWAVIAAIAVLIAIGVELVRHWHQIWGAVTRAVGEAVDFIKGHWKLLLEILTGTVLIAAVVHNWAKIKHAVLSAADEVISWVRSHWKLILAILEGPIGLAVLFIVSHWRQITAGAAEMFHDVVSFFSSLPGHILSVLGNMGNLLWNAGAAIIRGLLGGLKAGWNDVTGFVGGIGSWISSHKGPIEADQVLLQPHGQAIMRGLVGGLRSGMPSLGSQLARTTAAISGGVRPGAGGGYGGGGRLDVYLHFQPAGNRVMDAIVDGLKVEVRSRGGGGPHSVQRALGRVWPA